eukprot:m.213141 g.213141  ORF g.213141 m.213141 type:complete len:319 (+) comp15081_c0_seq1:118-1074(+)
MAQAKVQQLLIEWLADPEVRQTFNASIDLLRVGEWQPTLPPPSSTPSNPGLRSPSAVSSVHGASASGTPKDSPVQDQSPTLARKQDLLRNATLKREDSTSSDHGAGSGRSPLSRVASTGSARVDQTSTHTCSLPPFFHQFGDAASDDLDADIADEVVTVFGQADTVMDVVDFELVASVCGLSKYLAASLYSAAGGTKDAKVKGSRFLKMWNVLTHTYHDAPSRAMYALNPTGTGLTPSDLRPLIMHIIQTHPGLDFLVNSPSYHERYIDTVVARIFYDVNTSWSGTISLRELRRSSFLSVLLTLDHELNINRNALLCI